LIWPLAAPSFRAFWARWNPVYGYVLLFFVYPAANRVLPRRLALWVTFLVSGFVLHELPSGFAADWVRGHAGVPSVTILFAFMGALAVADDALNLNWSRMSRRARVAINLLWLAVGFSLRYGMVAWLRAR
jgi:hypothetical protein